MVGWFRGSVPLGQLLARDVPAAVAVAAAAAVGDASSIARVNLWD